MGRIDLRINMERRHPRNYKFNKEEANSSPTRTSPSSSRSHGIEDDHASQVGNQSDDDNVADVFKDMGLYLAAKNGDFLDLYEAIGNVSEVDHQPFEQILSRVSPAGNTFVHIAAKKGDLAAISYIAAKYTDVLFKKNLNGDTALHLVSKAGYVSLLLELVPSVKDLQDLPSGEDLIAARNHLLRIKNKRGNTALLEALKNGRESVAQYLIKQDPEMLRYQNHEGESALYLAAQAGFAGCVSSILQLSTDEEHMKNQFKEKSPIQAAILKMNKDVLEVMLNSNPSFIKLRDTEGRTPLHYAVSLGYLEGVSYLLKRYASNVSKMDKSGSCPIHLAALEGHLDILKLLLEYCPAPSELLDRHGRNILHVAAMNGRNKVVKYILDNPEFEELINMKDLDENSPLHLATMEWHPRIVSSLTWDKRVDVNLVNNEGMTALDAAEYHMSENPPFSQRLTWTALKAAGTPRSGKVVKRCPSSNSYAAELVKERVNTLLLVSTLVATITFAAGFTMPGGYNSSDKNPGMATMLRETGFHVFVFCDTIAMHCSIIVDVALIFAQLGDPNLVLTALNFALPLLGISLGMMSLAFTAGVFVVVGNLRWLSIAVLVLGLTFLSILLFLLFPLCMPYTSNNRVLRYLTYYPFCLLILATRS